MPPTNRTKPSRRSPSSHRDRGPGESEPTPLARRIAEMEARRDDLQRQLFGLSTKDPDPIRTCLDRIARASATGPDDVQAALDLADIWRDLHRQLADLDASETDAERRLRVRLEAARKGAADAEHELAVPNLQPEQVADLEAAHNAVLAAQKKTESWLSGPRALARLEHARAAEREVLDKLGFTTYAAYMMSSSSRGLGAARAGHPRRGAQPTGRGRSSVAGARTRHLQGLCSAKTCMSRLAAVTPQIASLLGHEPKGPAAEQELRALVDPAVLDEAVRDLRLALRSAGVEAADDQLDQEELVAMGDAWIERETGGSRRGARRSTPSCGRPTTSSWTSGRPRNGARPRCRRT